MLVRVSNLIVINSTTGIVQIGIRFNALEGDEMGYAEFQGTSGREMSSAARFEGLTVGVAHDISLYWKTTGGTATIFQAYKPVFEIIEYD